MQWLKKLLGQDDQNTQLERLVRRLIFYQDEATVLGALREATSYAPQGNDLGVRALSEAIRRRSGKPHVEFYCPAFGELKSRSGSEITEAEGKIIALAEARTLLDNPAVSQDLISAAMTLIHGEGMTALAHRVLIAGGVEQFYSFQLLYNHIHSTIQLAHARGARSWTEKMSKGGPPQFG